MGAGTVGYGTGATSDYGFGTQAKFCGVEASANLDGADNAVRPGCAGYEYLAAQDVCLGHMLAGRAVLHPSGTLVALGGKEARCTTPVHDLGFLPGQHTVCPYFKPI